MGIDPAWGSSAFGIVVTQWAEMLSTVYGLMSKYDVDKVYIDGANPSLLNR